MSAKLPSPISIHTLERELYAIKRRTDILLVLITIKEEKRNNEVWEEFLTYLYNAINGIENIPYLLSKKTFPGSHYYQQNGKRLTLKRFKKDFNEILERTTNLHSLANEVDMAQKIDSSALKDLAPEVEWTAWYHNLEIMKEKVELGFCNLSDY